ncbi:MAG: VCBS repeat-containing protein [Bacteroidota bacterium]
MTVTPEFNILNYMYFYNGGGVSLEDFNGDGLVDLFFTSNQDSNRLYVNKGNFQFEDVSKQANVFGMSDSWTTGSTTADVNGDGLVDIYVSMLGNYRGYFAQNLLYINQGTDNHGIPTFKEESAKYGLDIVGFSTQALFFDYDLDGDLDMYQLNHSVHSNGTYRPRKELLNTKHQLSGDKLMRNNHGYFEDVTDSAGLHSSALGYGLGVGLADLNDDGYPDIYVGNDFHEDDYLYINQQDGTFKDALGDYIRHTSRYSMGNDLGDI